VKTLTIALLGPFEVKLDDEPVTRFEYAKVRALLAYLALEAPRPCLRGELAALLWPDQPERAARGSLSQALTTLRGALGDKTRDRPVLFADANTVQLDPTDALELDVSKFLALLQASEAHAHRSWRSCTPCAERLRQAMALYRGPFLADVLIGDSAAFEEWASLQREHLVQRVLTALDRLAQWMEWRGRFTEAVVQARRQIEIEPLLEENQRALMRLLALNGETAAAIVQFNQLKRVLAHELGAEPEPATTALAEQIRRGDTAVLRRSPARFSVPMPPTRLVGREQQLQAVCARIRDDSVRLVTLSGTGGIGKTRLALAAAQELRYDFDDGVCFVDLAPLTDPAFVPDAFAQALNITVQIAQDLVETLRRHLRTRQVLLIVDNFEHVLAAATVVAELLMSSPWLKVLVTSRQPLQVRAEQLIWLEPLANSEAVELFTDRAQAAGADLATDVQSRKLYASICQGLDGLPLAIELTAVRAQELSPGELLRQVRQPLQRLGPGLRDAPARQQTLRDTLRWSFDLLNTEQRRAFTHLAVFAGGCTAQAAQAVLGETTSVAPLLFELHRASLLQQRGDADEARFWMLDTVRAFALETAAVHDQLQGASERHAQFFVQLAETAEREFLGPRQGLWLERVAGDYDNLRQAMVWCTDHDPVMGLRIAAALERFYEWRGNRREGQSWLDTLLDRARQAPAALRAKALRVSGIHAYRSGQYPAAAAALHESLHLWKGLGDQPGEVARVHNILGNVAFDQEEFDRATAEYRLALEMRRRLGDRWGLASVLNNLGLVYHSQGDLALAESTFAESLSLYREIGDAQSAASTLGNLADVALTRRQPKRAGRLYQESLAIRQEIGDRVGVGDALNGLGNVAMQLKDYAVARSHWVEAWKQFVELEHFDGQAESLAGLAAAALVVPDPEHAARLLGVIQAISDENQATFEAAARRAISAMTEAALDALGPERFDAERAKGYDLTPDQRFELAAW
jgi:predicted ATPase/DNA-binding SARP family transcriptional activator/Tfp pilus assembly protein PilF